MDKMRFVMRKRACALAVLAVAAMLLPSVLSAQMNAWTLNAGNQEVGYAGLGNRNECLASACVNVSAGKPTITFKVFGSTASGKKGLDFVKGITVYARKRDTGYDYSTDGNGGLSFTPENTFAHIYDYRDPVHNLGAIKVVSTTEVPEAGVVTTLTGDVALEAGEYVFYLTADIKSADEIGGITELPEIGGTKRNFTRIGGEIATVSDATITLSGTDYTTDGGGRVIIPRHQLMYVPKYEGHSTGADYSKYYRIPAFTRTADGSLIALSDARKNHVHDVSNDIDILFRRSTDNGQTWSNHTVIFEGTKNGTSGCADDSGFGDCAIASFPDGKVLAAAVSGHGLNGNASDAATDIVWKVSRDNGQTWGPINKMDHNIFGNLRGNISPGCMCVPKAGHLKGKAVAVIRTYNGNWNEGATSVVDGRQSNLLFIVAYDPSTNQWTNVKIGSRNYEAHSDAAWDEAQLVELGDNDLLLSIRCNNDCPNDNSYPCDNHRAYYRIAIDSPTASHIDIGVWKRGMSIYPASNGSVLNYSCKTATGSDETYVMQLLPKDAFNGARSSLALYYDTTKDLTKRDRVDFTRSLTLSDPLDNTDGRQNASDLGGLDETAQYSSITEQLDGSLGILYEGYPITFRTRTTTECTGAADYVMAQYYMNLRAGDLIEGAVAHEPAQINAPVISQKERVYDAQDVNDRPTITISHDNYEAYSEQYDATNNKVTINYLLEFTGLTEGPKTSTVLQYDGSEVTPEITWAKICTALGISDANVVDGTCLKVLSYCTAEDGKIISGTTTEHYQFAWPVTNIKVVCVPSAGAGDVSMIADGTYAGNDEWLTVPLGSTVRLNAPANKLFAFKGFYKSSDLGDANLLPTSALKPVSGMAHQVTLDTKALNDSLLLTNIDINGDSQLEPRSIVIYAAYDVNGAIATRVNTQYNDWKLTNKVNYKSYASWYAPTENTRTNAKRKTSGISYSGNSVETMKDGDTFPATLSFISSSTQDMAALDDNYSTHENGESGVLYYPSALNYGLDAYVTVLPDAFTAANLNAIVVARRTNDESQEEYLSDYYVLQGLNNPLGPEVTAGAKGVFPWYSFENDEMVPMAVGMESFVVSHGDKYEEAGKLDFAQIFKSAEAATAGDVYVDIYLVGNTLTSLNTTDYVYKVTHKIQRTTNNNIVTAVEDVTSAKGIANVIYYNLLGMSANTPFEGVNVVKTVYTDGTSRIVKKMF